MEKLRKHFATLPKKMKESHRLFHGRGKSILELDSFNIDYFYPYVMIILYKELSESDLVKIKEILLDYDSDISGIVVQKRYLNRPLWECIYGTVEEEFVVKHQGVNYKIEFLKSQNVGLFLDMEQGRDWIFKNANEKCVLNLFSYTGAFSLMALKGGAKKVINLDMSHRSQARAKENHRLNELNLNQVKFLSHDIFKSLGRIKREGPYDLVIIDPPTHQGDHFSVAKDYPKIIKRLVEWTTPDALVLTVLNSPHHDFQYLENLVENNSDAFNFVDKLTAPEHFLETNIEHGLKMIVWKRK